MMQHFYHKLAAIAVSAVLASPAFAESFAYANSNDFYWVLTDLDPKDGISPSITWNDNYDSMVFGGFTIGTNAPMTFTTYGAGVFGTVSDRVVTLDTYASASVNDTSMQVAGAADVLNSSFYAGAYPGTEPSRFTLSAKTEVQFFLWANVLSEAYAQVNTDNHAQSSIGLGVFDGYNENANWIAVSGSEISSTSNNGVTYVTLYDYGSASTVYNSQHKGWWNSSLEVGYRNTSDSLKTGYIFSYAQVEGYSVSPVPEPRNYALLLAGLGLISWLAKRRTSLKTWRRPI